MKYSFLIILLYLFSIQFFFYLSPVLIQENTIRNGFSLSDTVSLAIIGKCTFYWSTITVRNGVFNSSRYAIDKNSIFHQIPNVDKNYEFENRIKTIRDTGTHSSGLMSNAKSVFNNNNITFSQRTSFLRRYRNSSLQSQESFSIKDYSTKSVYLFIVNYNFCKYGSLHFVDDEYFTRFARLFKEDFDVVHIGPCYNGAHRILSNNLRQKGFVAYHSFAVVLDLFPSKKGFNYSGVFFMNDDSYVDPLFLNELDFNKSFSEPRIKWPLKDRWPWNRKFNGYGVLIVTSFLNATRHIESLASSLLKCNFSNVKLVRGYADFFYVTRNDISFFLTMENEMFKYKAFLELAVPTMMECLTDSIIDDCNHQYMSNIRTCVHVHPLKYSKASSKLLMINRIERKNMTAIPIKKY